MECWEKVIFYYFSCRLIYFKDNDIDKWKGSIAFIESFEFKFIITENGKEPIWESGDNRKFNYNIVKSLENQNLPDFNFIYDKSVPNTIKLICNWKK